MEHDASTSPRFDSSQWNIPVELYQEIFRIAACPPVAEPWDPTFDLGPSGDPRAIAPYQIAATCSRWRALAKATPDLWTFIRVHRDDYDHPERLEQVERHLGWSGNQSLHVVMDVVYDAHGVALFKRITEAMPRLRRVCFFLPRTRVPADVVESLSALAQALPVLEEIHMQPTTHDANRDTTAKLELAWQQLEYFPCAPRARRIVSLSLCIPPSQPLPALESITLSLRTTSDKPLWMAMAAAPGLKELRVYFPRHSSHFPRDDDELKPPPVMYALRHLAFYGYCSDLERLGQLRAPVLETLGLPVESGMDYGPLYNAVAETVRHVVYTTIENDYGGLLTATDIQAVVLLARVETFELLNLSPHRLTESFFNYLRLHHASNPPGWPNLRRITLRNCSFDLGDCESLLGYVHDRVDARSDQTPFEFELVDSTFQVTNSGVPSWFKEEILNLVPNDALENVSNYSNLALSDDDDEPSPDVGGSD